VGLSRHRQMLARRNYLLQSGLSDGALRNALAPWNEQLARVGLELVGRRRGAVSALEGEGRHLSPALAGVGERWHGGRATRVPGRTGGPVRRRGSTRPELGRPAS